VDRHAFWEIIATSRKRGDGNHDAQFAALEEQLGRLSVEEVASFDAHFRVCRRRADCKDVYAAAAIIDGFWVSDDAFTYFLQWLIAQGEQVFENTVANSDSLADVVQRDEVCTFEGFGYIAARVWEQKTGRSAAQMHPTATSPAPAPDGPAWEDDADLQRRFPRLWAKFSQQ
jgi:hypothetical protein